MYSTNLNVSILTLVFILELIHLVLIKSLPKQINKTKKCDLHVQKRKKLITKFILRFET